MDWGPVPLFAPWKHCSQCGWLYNSPFSKRPYSGRQESLESTTRGSPLAARGGTMGEKWWPNGAWDLHPGFFYMPQICDMGPIILLPFRRKACWGFFSALIKIQRLRPGLNPRTWVSEAMEYGYFLQVLWPQLCSEGVWWLKSWNACYHSVQNLLSSGLLSKY